MLESFRWSYGARFVVNHIVPEWTETHNNVNYCPLISPKMVKFWHLSKQGSNYSEVTFSGALQLRGRFEPKTFGLQGEILDQYSCCDYDTNYVVMFGWPTMPIRSQLKQ